MLRSKIMAIKRVRRGDKWYDVVQSKGLEVMVRGDFPFEDGGVKTLDMWWHTKNCQEVEFEKVYLGDSVYVKIEDGVVVVYTDNGIKETNKIFLDPDVVEKLVSYLNLYLGRD